MSVIDKIKHWLATEADDDERARVQAQVSPPGGAVAAINSVALTGPQLRAAIGTIQHLPIRDEADMIRHAQLLSAFAVEYGFTPALYAGAALHARSMALERWCHAYDPYGQTDIEAFFEAGAKAPLVENPEGLGFEPHAFAGLIERESSSPR